MGGHEATPYIVKSPPIGGQLYKGGGLQKGGTGAAVVKIATQKYGEKLAFGFVFLYLCTTYFGALALEILGYGDGNIYGGRGIIRADDVAPATHAAYRHRTAAGPSAAVSFPVAVDNNPAVCPFI